MSHGALAQTQQLAARNPLLDLSLEDLFFNHALSSLRIVVEHSLAGVKRCRIVKDVLRNTKAGFSDVVMEVACALHNLRLDFRQPTPTLDILTFSP